MQAGHETTSYIRYIVLVHITNDIIIGNLYKDLCSQSCVKSSAWNTRLHQRYLEVVLSNLSIWLCYYLVQIFLLSQSLVTVPVSPRLSSPGLSGTWLTWSPCSLRQLPWLWSWSVQRLIGLLEGFVQAFLHEVCFFLHLRRYCWASILLGAQMAAGLGAVSMWEKER